MHSIKAVTIGSISAYIGLLALIVVIYAVVLKFAGRLLYALGPIGIGGMFLFAIFLAIVPSAALGGATGFLVAMITLSAMWFGWFLYATGNPNYELGTNASKGTNTGQGELDVDGIERNGSRITQEDSSRNVQPRWVRYVRRLGIAALVGLFIRNALGGSPPYLYIFGGFLVFFIVPFSIMVMRSRLVMSSAETRRRLMISMKANTMPDPSAFSTLHWRDPESYQYSNRLIAGHLSLTNEGLEWTPGRRVLPAALRRLFITGEMKIPWNWIERITIGRDANVLVPIGGYLTIELSDSRGCIDGRYLGSRPMLTKALQATPLGREK